MQSPRIHKHMKKRKVSISNDSENVYLEVDDISECCFELWEIGNEKKSTVKVKIPIESWKKLIKDWKNKNHEEKKNETL